MTTHADVAILTVIPAELQAARRAIGLADRPSERLRNGTNYWAGSMYSYRCRRKLRIMLGCIGAAGNPDSAAATAEIIAYCQPQAVLLVGIAAGMRGKIKIGEVALSERVVAYEPAALVIEPNGKETTISRSENTRTQHNITQDVVYYLSQQRRVERLQKNFLKLEGNYPIPAPRKQKQYEKLVASTIATRNSTIASGEKLIRNPNILYSWQKTLHGKIELAEMEATGLMTACHRAQIPWLVVRGISDFGDKFKNDAFHGFASLAATTVLVDFIRYSLYSEMESLDSKSIHKGRSQRNQSNESHGLNAGIIVSAQSGGVAIGSVVKSKLRINI